MGEVTAIEWCDHTFNPWIGCTKVSPACDHCYAEALMDTRYRKVEWGAGNDRIRTTPGNWSKPLAWNRKAKETGTRPFVFCASLADVFDNEVDPMWRRDLFALMRSTPYLVWLPLTKRIGNVVKMADDAGGYPENAAIGATLPNQDEWDRDAWKLDEAKHKVGALFSFASIEPMLSPIDMGFRVPDWVIVGGESGQFARPMNLEWARSLKRQTEKAGAVFNFKQVGGKTADHGGHELDGQRYFGRPAPN